MLDVAVVVFDESKSAIQEAKERSGIMILRQSRSISGDTKTYGILLPSATILLVIPNADQRRYQKL
jgi:hypothetical protein